MGFLSGNHAQILHNNSLIDTHCIEAARQNGVTRYLCTSSACFYPEPRQTATNSPPLKDENGNPVVPQDAEGWEQPVGERPCIQYREDYGFEARMVRLHNIFGPLGPWLGGRERAPAALCRKVAAAKLEGSHEIEILGGRGTNQVLLLHR